MGLHDSCEKVGPMVNFVQLSSKYDQKSLEGLWEWMGLKYSWLYKF